MQKDPRVVCQAQHATPRTRATSDEFKARDESSPPRADNALQSQRGGAATEFGERGGVSPMALTLAFLEGAFRCDWLVAS